MRASDVPWSLLPGGSSNGASSRSNARGSDSGSGANLDAKISKFAVYIDSTQVGGLAGGAGCMHTDTALQAQQVACHQGAGSGAAQ